MRYLVTRQNSNGTFDTAGMNNRIIISGYKTYKNAFKFGINPFGRGRVCKVEVFNNGNLDNPIETFRTLTFN